MNRRPTIIDVARAAGVSKSTVSLVLQDSPLVRAETRVIVRQAMADLGYVYNRSAATLRSSNTGLLGLVINDLRNPFFTEFATSVQMALSARGYATVVANTDEDPGLQAQVVAAMIEHGVSAVVISPCHGDQTATFGPLERSAIPTLQVLRKAEERTDMFPYVAPDNVHGGRLAIDHLLGLGARRIAFVGGHENMQVTKVRIAGYHDALAAAGIAPLVLHGRSTRAFGRDAAAVLLRDHPDCDSAICFNDLVALGMMNGLAELGRKVGHDFRLVGFDDIEECAQAYPPLSTVRANIAGLGRGIAATVLAWLEDGVRPPREVLSPVELVIRASSDRLPGGGSA